MTGPEPEKKRPHPQGGDLGNGVNVTTLLVARVTPKLRSSDRVTGALHARIAVMVHDLADALVWTDEPARTPGTTRLV
jgi:hypothetical protein